jgi:hypothetical protein
MNIPPSPLWSVKDGKIFYWLSISYIPGVWQAYQDALERVSNWCDSHMPETRYEDRLNGRYYFAQCTQCGKRLEPVKRSLIVDVRLVRPFDFDLRDRITDEKCSRRATLKALYELKSEQWNQRNQKQLAEWYRYHHNARRKIYETYIKSEQWRGLRMQVLARDGYVCQVCKAQRAAQVHHLTYEHFQHEPLEDLLSVCLTCHEQIHS